MQKTNDAGHSAGGLICMSSTADVPAWGMHIAGGVATLLGLPILCASVPLLFGNRQGDFTGGAAGTTVALILLGAGVAAFVSARTHRSLRYRFHERGILIGRRDDDLSFTPYSKLKEIVVELQRPSTLTSVSNTAAGALALMSGQNHRAGHAINNMIPKGIVRYRTDESQDVTSLECNFAEAERLGSHLESLLKLPVLMRNEI